MSVSHQHHEHAGHSHGHIGAHSAAAQSSGRLKIVLGLTASYLAAEVVGAWFTNSLALLADAAHMLIDVAGLAMALLAIRFAQRPATPRRTYGFYRAEILAAFLNGLLLLGIAGYVLFEAWHRLSSAPAVHGLPMLGIALGGLVVNVIGVILLHQHAGESLNARGAYLEVLSDLLGSVGVIVAALLVEFTGWWQADAIVSILIGLFIVPRTWSLLTSALDVLLEASPRDLDTAEIEDAMLAVAGVVAVHELHIWTITSGFVAMSAHVVSRDRAGADVLHDLQVLLREHFKIEHATIQVERTDHTDDGACCSIDPRCLVVGGPSPWRSVV